MIFLRQEAIRLAAFVKMFTLSSQIRRKKIDDAVAESGGENLTESERIFCLRRYLENELKKVRNVYLEELLTNAFGEAVEVEGEEVRLFSCPCCNYITLEKRGEYFICSVCFWEDDGNIDSNHFSSVNRMTVEEGRQNFKSFGAVRKEYLQDLYEDRTSRFSKRKE
jgi:hypothetical protein